MYAKLKFRPRYFALNHPDIIVSLTWSGKKYQRVLDGTCIQSLTVADLLKGWGIAFSGGKTICGGKTVTDGHTRISSVVQTGSTKAIRFMFIANPGYNNSDEPHEPLGKERDFVETQAILKRVNELHIGLADSPIASELFIRDPRQKADIHILIHDGEFSLRDLFQAVSGSLELCVGSYDLIYNGNVISSDDPKAVVGTIPRLSRLLMRFNQIYWQEEQVKTWISDSERDIANIESNIKHSLLVSGNERIVVQRDALHALQSMSRVANNFSDTLNKNSRLTVFRSRIANVIDEIGTMMRM